MFGDALRRGHTRRYIFVAVAIVVLGAALLAGQALADSGSTDSSFRTAVVKRATVSQTLQRSGTVEPIAQGTVAFPIAGTISSVAVQAGQTVATGQTLASLDTTALQAALAAQQASLAAAQLTLSNALNGISSTPSNGNARSTTTTTPRASASAAPSTANATSANTSAGTADPAALTQARRAVASGKQQVDESIATANVALTEAGRACAASSSSSSANPSSSSTSTSSSSSTSSTSTSTSVPPPSSASSACVDALQRSLSAQQQVAGAESALAQAQDTLGGLLNESSTTGAASRTAATAVSSQSTASSASASASASGPSAAELVADQAAVDAAQADLTAAQQNLAQGTVVSPIEGTVAAVNMTPGEQVSAGSSTANVIVVGPGGYEVTTTVNVTDIGKLKLGDAATATPDGSSTPLDGKVVSIGVMPATSGNTTVYPVVVGLTGASSPDLHNGGSAAVTIILNQAADALTVPTSAVRSAAAGGLQLVSVLEAGKTSVVPVQVGAVGAELTEIRSGLQAGQTVVLADLSQAVPSNSTATNARGGFGGGGAFGGGGGTLGGGNGGGTRTFTRGG